MLVDIRKKGCPNEDCEQHIKRIKMSVSNDFCPKCGSKLIFVCAKCFKEIQDEGPQHRLCDLCEAKALQKAQAVKGKALKAGKAVVAVAVPVVIGLSNKVLNNVQDIVVEKGAKIVNNVVNNVLDK